MRVRQALEGKWLGHPLHPLLVHVPLGLWLFGAGLDVASWVMGAGAWTYEAAAWTLLVGTVMALPTVVTGFNDWLDIREDHPAQNKALWHMALMGAATGIFVVDTVLHFKGGNDYPLMQVMVFLSVLGYALTLVGGYIGGTLIYDEGISVGRHRRTTRLPQVTLHEPRKGTMEGPMAPHVGLGAEYHPVIPLAGLPEGHTLRVEIEGTIVMVTRVGERVFAVQEFCTHRCGPLSEGEVIGGEIRCPWHGSRFDLATGKVSQGPAKVDLKTFEVRIHNDIVHVRLEPAGAPVDQRLGERRNPAEFPQSSRPATQEQPTRRMPSSEG